MEVGDACSFDDKRDDGAGVCVHGVGIGGVWGGAVLFDAGGQHGCDAMLLRRQEHQYLRAVQRRYFLQGVERAGKPPRFEWVIRDREQACKIVATLATRRDARAKLYELNRSARDELSAGT